MSSMVEAAADAANGVGWAADAIVVGCLWS